MPYLLTEIADAGVMSFKDIQWVIIAGGLGLFLFGIKYMGDGLKAFGGDKLKDIIDKYTSSPIKGIMIGTLVTCLIQSSSGTTALTIGLIRSGLMSMDQAVGIIMGANIGTTITAVLVGLKISKYALYFVIVGACMLMFSNKKKMQYGGQVLFGFGALFYGLDLMGAELGMITNIPQFSNMTEFLAGNPLFSLLGSTLMTTVIQSSSAVIAIVQQMYSAGAINLAIALPFLFGSNIGTTITAVLACLGGSTASKRAASFHVMFNVLGTAIFMLFLTPFTMLLNYLLSVFSMAPEMQLALAHGIFNIITTIVLYPFIPYFVKFIKNIIKSDGKEITVNLGELDTRVVDIFPSHALGIAKVKTVEMGNLTLEAMKNVALYIEEKSHTHFDTVMQLENAINTSDKKITEYLQLIAHETMNDADTNNYVSIMKSIKDFERIGDLCVNIIEMCESVFDEREDFSKDARKDLMKMLDVNVDMIEKAIIAFDKIDLNARNYVDEQENYLDRINNKAKQRHIHRVATKEETSTIVISTYIDILSQLERVGDHCQNISESYLLHDDYLDTDLSIL